MGEKCTECDERLSRLLDGDLGPKELSSVEEHLRVCADCRTELEALRRTAEAVRGLPQWSAPEGFAESVMARVEATASTPNLVKMLWARALPVAALFLVIVGLLVIIRPNGIFRDEPSPQLAMRRPVAENDGASEARPMPATRSVARVREREPAEQKALTGGAGPHKLEADAAFGVGPALRRRAETPTGPEAPPMGQPQQVLTMLSQDPTAVVSRVIDLARHNRVRGRLVFGRNDELDLYLEVPPERYYAFMRAAAELAPPERQMLRNTRAGQDVFFRQAAQDYEYFLVADRQVEDAEGERRSKGTEALGMAPSAIEGAREKSRTHAMDAADELASLRTPAQRQSLLPAKPIALRVLIQPAPVDEH